MYITAPVRCPLCQELNEYLPYHLFAAAASFKANHCPDQQLAYISIETCLILISSCLLHSTPWWSRSGLICLLHVGPSLEDTLMSFRLIHCCLLPPLGCSKHGRQLNGVRVNMKETPDIFPSVQSFAFSLTLFKCCPFIWFFTFCFICSSHTHF